MIKLLPALLALACPLAMAAMMAAPALARRLRGRADQTTTPPATTDPREPARV